MFAPSVIQFAALAVTVLTAGCAVHMMRRTYNKHLETVARTTLAVEEFQRLQEQLISFFRRLESDHRALQKIALQVEATVAGLGENINVSMSASAERQHGIIETLRDHIDTQEERLARIVDVILEDVLPTMQPRQSLPESQFTDYSRLRRHALGQNPALRFSVLKEWTSINAIAILHRASRGWNTTDDLIAGVPAYLQPEGEILKNCILLIGTREHSERLALPLRKLDSSSDAFQWFDPTFHGNKGPCVPAVLVRSNGHFELVSKGTNSAALTN